MVTGPRPAREENQQAAQPRGKMAKMQEQTLSLNTRMWPAALCVMIKLYSEWQPPAHLACD